MDSFFASIEVREHPELKRKPVVLGADPEGRKDRGVMSTYSYEVREYDIHQLCRFHRLIGSVQILYTLRPKEALVKNFTATY
jgi:nucleotidyltransferase/DNA polymerase involved in DNA repair